MKATLLWSFFALGNALVITNKPPEHGEAVTGNKIELRSDNSEWQNNLELVAKTFANYCSFKYHPTQESGVFEYSIDVTNASVIAEFTNVTANELVEWWTIAPNCIADDTQYDNGTVSCGAWEWAEFHWSSSELIACSWADRACENPAGTVPNIYQQYVCVGFPADDMHDSIVGNVTCPECLQIEQPQTETLTSSTVTQTATLTSSTETPMATLTSSTETPTSTLTMRQAVPSGKTEGKLQSTLNKLDTPVKRAVDTVGPEEAPFPMDLPVVMNLTTLPDICQQAVDNARSKYKAPKMTWSSDIAPLAAEAANKCTIDYNTDSYYGETLFSFGFENSSSPSGLDLASETMIAFETWMGGWKYYHPQSDQYDNLTSFQSSWDFTQIIWQHTKEFGCGWSTKWCPNEKAASPATVLLFLCYFDPPGNKVPFFGGNVTCPACEAQLETIDSIWTPPPLTATEKSEDVGRVADALSFIAKT